MIYDHNKMSHKLKYLDEIDCLETCFRCIKDNFIESSRCSYCASILLNKSLIQKFKSGIVIRLLGK